MENLKSKTNRSPVYGNYMQISCVNLRAYIIQDLPKSNLVLFVRINCDDPVRDCVAMNTFTVNLRNSNVIVSKHCTR